jgi:aminoglycoside/choline kinase family phosphotransferase
LLPTACNDRVESGPISRHTVEPHDDLREGRMSQTSTKLPAMPDGITPEWLSDVLRADGCAPPGAQIASIRRSRVGDGIGMMSELSRLHLEWSQPQAGLPATLIAKYSSTNPTNRAVAMNFHVYEREVRYYAEVDQRTTASTPHWYLSVMEGENFLILMEDLGDYRIGSQAVGADLTDTQLAVDELVKLHAPFWDNVSEFGWVPHVADSYHASNMNAFAHSGWDQTMAVFGHLVPESFKRRRQDFLDAIPTMQARMDRAPITFVHGDFRLDNLLFAAAPGHAPAVIIDWQGPLLSRGMFDVALFLGQNVLTEVRRQHEQALVRRYVHGLAAFGIDYPFDAAWQDYLDALLFQWVYATVVSGALDTSHPATFAWMSQMIARQAAATDDHRLLERLP